MRHFNLIDITTKVSFQLSSISTLVNSQTSFDISTSVTLQLSDQLNCNDNLTVTQTK